MRAKPKPPQTRRFLPLLLLGACAAAVPLAMADDAKYDHYPSY